MKQTNIEELLSTLVQATEQKRQEWEITSRWSMFGTYLNGNYVTIDQTDNSIYEISIYDTKGDVQKKETINIESIRYTLANTLYHAIINGNTDFRARYEEAIRITIEEKLHTITKAKLSKRLNISDEKTMVNDNPYFGYENINDSKFEMPPLLQIATTEEYTPLDEAEVMVIAAPGATGKTILSKQLSQSFNFLRLDLGIFGAVGSNSLLGVFADNFKDKLDLVNMSVNLQQGKTTMIIDGLDEASLKTTESGFEGFLDDIIKLAKGANGLSFILLGRTKVVEDTCVYLEDAGVKVILTQIEPFTEKGAKSFVDKQQEGDNYKKQYGQYCEVRDYVIESIQGFFKKESDIKLQLYRRFIGYAPVLLAISKLLNEKGNYHELLQSLQKDQKSNVELVANIVERIMLREQDKIQNLIRDELLHQHSKDFCDEVLPKMYSIQEQCARLLAFVKGDSYSYNISDDEAFNHLYNKRIADWQEDHPLLDKARTSFQNVVFESYVLAFLMNQPDMVEKVTEYLTLGKGASYMLFDIYTYLNTDGKVDYHYISALYDSFTALDKAGAPFGKNIEIGEMQLFAIQSENVNEVHCMVDFSSNETKGISFETKMLVNETLVMPSYLRNVYIDAPIRVLFSGSKAEFACPVHIICKEVTMQVRDVVFTNPGKDASPFTDFSCETFNAVLPDGNVPRLTWRFRSNNCLSIFCKNKLSHPFADYKHDYFAPMRLDTQLLDKYQKLRRLFLLFRANGKNGLARLKSKIDNCISYVPVGQKVLNALVAEKIIYEKDVFYFIDTKRMTEVLETSYTDIQKCNISPRTSMFLHKIPLGS